MTGLSAWHVAMGGDWFRYGEVRGALDKYDVIYISLGAVDDSSFLVQRIKAEAPHAFIVVGLDYSIALWKESHNPFSVAQALIHADLVIYADPTMERWLGALQTKTPCRFVPYPCDVTTLARRKVEPKWREKTAMAFIHRYDKEWFAPHVVLANQGIRSCALVWDEEPKHHAFFDRVQEAVEYKRFMPFLAKQWLVVCSYHGIPAMGRIQMECAALGVPCVGTTEVYMQRTLWPQLTTPSFDLVGQRDLVKRLIADGGFYDAVCEQAATIVAEDYSLEPRAYELTKYIEEIRDGNTQD